VYATASNSFTKEGDAPECRALVLVGPAPAGHPRVRPVCASAPFLAHLIATRLDVPAMRVRRRECAPVATAIYRRAAAR
jgi:hypothetical protein